MAKNPSLRNYRTQQAAEAYADKLRKRFPDAAFDVRPSPFAAYPFRYLIRVTRPCRSLVAGTWVGR